MMLLPGCSAGNAISPSPANGPLFSAEFRMRVDARADCRAALRKAEQPRLYALQTRDPALHLGAPARELLPQRHWHRIHQVCASGLHDATDLALLGGEHIARLLERRH
jgi:hypothetical protein